MIRKTKKALKFIRWIFRNIGSIGRTLRSGDGEKNFERLFNVLESKDGETSLGWVERNIGSIGQVLGLGDGEKNFERLFNVLESKDGEMSLGWVERNIGSIGQVLGFGDGKKNFERLFKVLESKDGEKHFKRVANILCSNAVTKEFALYPLVTSDVLINGIKVRLASHQQDMVLGAMIRGEKEKCRFMLGELDFLQSVIKPGNKVLDAGANVGIIAVVLAKAEPTATIYCFEPDPFNYSLLNINILLNEVTNILTFNFALGKEQQFINMYLSKTNFGDHRSVKPTKYDLGESSFEMLPSRILKVNPCEILKSTLGEQAPSHIDILKIDTQGTDFEILSACLPLLSKGSIVTIEYSPYHIHSNGITMDDVSDLLSKFSMIKKISPIGETPRVADLSIDQMLFFYEEQYRKYERYYDVVLTY